MSTPHTNTEKPQASALFFTSKVLVHHIGSVFHKEAKHGGATRSTLQPEQDWSFLMLCLSGQGKHKSKTLALPCGDFGKKLSPAEFDHI